MKVIHGDYGGRGNRWNSITIRMGRPLLLSILIFTGYMCVVLSFGNIYPQSCCL